MASYFRKPDDRIYTRQTARQWFRGCSLDPYDLRGSGNMTVSIYTQFGADGHPEAD